MKFAIILVSVLVSGSAWSQEIILKLGESKNLPASGKAWVEKSKVIQVSDAGHSFVIRGMKPGTSLLKVGSKSYDVSVLSSSQEKA